MGMTPRPGVRKGDAAWRMQRTDRGETLSEMLGGELGREGEVFGVVCSSWKDALPAGG